MNDDHRAVLVRTLRRVAHMEARLVGLEVVVRNAVDGLDVEELNRIYRELRAKFEQVPEDDAAALLALLEQFDNGEIH